MTNIKILISTFILLGIIACQKKSDEIEKKAIARVEDRFLYLTDLENHLPANISQEDSISLSNQFIDKWIRQKIFYYKAHANIKDDLNNIEKKIQEYKEALFIHTYEQLLLTQNSEDIEVSTEAIDEYYTKHIEEQILKNDIVKADYIQIAKNIGDSKKIEKLLSSNDIDDMDMLKDYCFQYANKFYFSNNWIETNMLEKELPKNISIPTQFFNNRKVYTHEDSVYNYFVKIYDYREKNKIAPIEFVEPSIRLILLQKKRHEYIKEVRRKLYDDAMQRNTFEIFSNN